MQMNNNNEWLLKWAALEDNCAVAAGGPSLLPIGSEPQEFGEFTCRIAFARLIALFRRQRGLTVEKLAKECGVDASELLNIEECTPHRTEPRTVFRLSKTLNIPQDRLMILAGLSQPRSDSFKRATVQFAASSQPMHDLSQEEENALQAFVEVLAESTETE